MIQLFRSFLLINIILSAVVQAQEVDVPPSTDEKKKGRRTWIVATLLPDGIKSPVTVLAGGQLSEVRLSKRSVGEAIKVPKGGLIQLVKSILTEDGKTSYEVYGSAVIPEGVKESLIILEPATNLKQPLKFKARVIDLDKFRGGNALFVNNTKLEIGVTLGKKKALLTKGQIEIMDIGNFDGTKNVTVSYHYRTSKQKEWNLISASTVPLRSSLREILIFSYDPKTGRADYHGITFYMGK